MLYLREATWSLLRSLVIVLVFWFSRCAALYAQDAGPAAPPNIVLLYADDLGYGDLSSYGHPIIRTPHLDSLASEGLRLTSFYNAAAVCTPSRAALLTGRYPRRVGLAGGAIMPDSDAGLASEEVTIATALQDIGYRTKAIGKWHLGHAREEFLPTSHGFEEYFGLLYSNDMIPPWVQTDRPLRYYRNLEPVEGDVDQTRLTYDYTQEAVRFIEDAADGPFFLYLPYSMPHVPIYAPEERQGSSLAGKYGDVVETIDWSVGQIVSAIRRAGVSDNTIVIFTSDNGPWSNMPERMFSDDSLPGHEPIQRWDHGTRGLLRGAKGETYEGGFRVPAIIRWPGRVPAGTVSSDIVTTMDLFPTLAAATGAAVPADRTIDGNNVLSHLTGDAPSATQSLFYFSGNELHAVRRGPWKLRAPDGQNPELYHLDIDPSERYNRANERPELVEEMLEMMRDFGDRVREW